MTKTKECRQKVCPFLLLENSRPLSPWGPPDFLSTCLGVDSHSWVKSMATSQNVSHSWNRKDICHLTVGRLPNVTQVENSKYRELVFQWEECLMVYNNILFYRVICSSAFLTWRKQDDRWSTKPLGLPWWLRWEHLSAMQATWIQSLGWEDPLEKGRQPTPVFLPGESYGGRNLAGYSPWGHKE